jgi:sigma-B regulation protein RsbU (phosphoserine phosphatase)
VQLGFTMAVLVGISFLVTGWMVIERQRETLTQQFTLRLLSETRGLALAASGPLLRHDPEFELRPFVVKALAEVPGLVDLAVLDVQGKVQGHRDLLQVDRDFARPPLGSRVALAGISTREAWLENDAIVIEQPIRHVGEPIGTLVARASRAGIETVLGQAQAQLLWMGSIASLLSIAAVWLLVRFALRPLDALRHGVLRLASGDLAARVPAATPNELGLFAGLVNSMAAGLQAAQRDMIVKERLDRELEIARDLQSMLLPHQTTPATGYEIQAHYVPALEVSGDYYDVLRLDDRRLALLAADVSGKGVPGLVVMSMLRTALHMLAPASTDVASVLVQASRTLRGSLRPGMFLTCVYGILDTERHQFRYVCAGHCPPIVFGSEAPRLLEAGGKPIGMFPDAVFERSLRTHETRLEPGAGLLLYSDGLTEALDPGGRPLGLAKILTQLRDEPAAPAAKVVSGLLETVDRHRAERAHSDDLTLMVLRRTAAAAPASPVPAPGAARTRPLVNTGR